MSDSTGSWQPDPHGRHQYRYWDGTQWTDQVADDGVSAVDPPDAVGAPPPEGETPAAATPADATPTDATPADSTPVDSTPTEPTSAAVPPPSDPTTSWGAPPTDPGATTSMPVGGSVPPTDPSVDAPKKSSGNKPALIIGGVLLLLLIGAGAWLLLGGNDDDDDLRAEIISDLTEDGGMTDEQANCFVDELESELGMEEIRTIDESGGEDLSAEQMSAVLAAVSECGVDGFGDGEALPDDTDTDTDTDDEDGGLADGISGNQALLDLFIQGIMQGSDLSEDQARCFSEEFFANPDLDLEELMANAEAMGSDPDVMSAFFDIFETCGIDPSALGSGATGSSGDADTYGDDATLDALWDSCEDGDDQACDDLYFQSPIGSEYEAFGDTCGGRQDEGTGELCDS